MNNTRRKALARLFALILLIELTTLCCACSQLESHCCPSCSRCAICEYLRIPMENAIRLCGLLLTLVIASVVLRRSGRLDRFSFSQFTLIDQKVELDD